LRLTGLFEPSLTCNEPVVFETFPHAIACSLVGKVVSARRKSSTRRALLSCYGVNEGSLPNIDYVDAALCALAARWLNPDRRRVYGDAIEGYLLVPCIKDYKNWKLPA
jgi:predicted RNase H-like nuclease